MMKPDPLTKKPLGAFERLFFPVIHARKDVEGKALLKRRARYSKQLADHLQAEKLLKKELEKEARIYAQLLVNCWTRRRAAFMAKSAHISTEGQGVNNAKVVKVRFARIRTTPEEIWYQILVGQRTLFGAHRDMLPFGVDVAELTNDEALFELGFACQRKVESWVEIADKGAWVIVKRLEGVGGIPINVAWEHMLPHYTGESSKGPIVLGSVSLRDLRTTTLAESFHILIAGSSGGGKSNMINGIICGLMRFTDPNELQMILIDPKRLELGRYNGAPHLMRPVIYNTKEAVEVLQQLMKEVERRTALLENKATELSEWNERYPSQKMPRIVVVVDEFAQLMLAPEPELAKQATNLVIQIVNTARALGIHLILATQYPDKSVLKNAIKINMGLTIAARTQNASQSIVIIGTGDASRLPKVPGRMLAMSGTERFEVQTPLIMRDDVTRSIGISKGKARGFITIDGAEVSIDYDRVICHIFDDMGGMMNPERLWRAFVPFGVPAADLKAFLAGVLKARSYTTKQEPIRDFVIHDYAGTWRLVEITPGAATRPAPNPNAEGSYPLDVDRTFARITASKAPEPWIALPANVPEHPRMAAAPDRPAIEVVEDFIKERCNVGARLKVTSKALYAEYTNFCQEHDEAVKSANSFGRLISSLGFMRFIVNGDTGMRSGLELVSATKEKEVA